MRQFDFKIFQRTSFLITFDIYYLEQNYLKFTLIFCITEMFVQIGITIFRARLEFKFYKELFAHINLQYI